MERRYFAICRKSGHEVDRHYFALGAKKKDLAFQNALTGVENLWKVQFPGCTIRLKFRMVGGPGRAPSASDIKAHLPTEDLFFSRDTMRFFGQRMRDFRTSWAIAPCPEYPQGIVYLWARSHGTHTTERYAVPHFGGAGKYRPARLFIDLEGAKEGYNAKA